VAEVEHEAARGLEDAQSCLAETREPLDVGRLLLIPLTLLAEQGKRWARDDQIDGLLRQQSELIETVTDDLGTEPGPVQHSVRLKDIQGCAGRKEVVHRWRLRSGSRGAAAS
jgi:hypothetical protein